MDKIYEIGDQFKVGRCLIECVEATDGQCDKECFYQERGDCPQCFASWRPDGKYVKFKVVTK